MHIFGSATKIDLLLGINPARMHQILHSNTTLTFRTCTPGYQPQCSSDSYPSLLLKADKPVCIIAEMKCVFVGSLTGLCVQGFCMKSFDPLDPVPPSLTFYRVVETYP